MKLSYIINILFLTCLILLIGIAYYRSTTQIPPYFSHKTTENNQPIHELDNTVLDSFEFALDQATTAHDVAIAKHKPAYAQKFRTIIKRLKKLEKQYTSTSPGLALLGPFGTTSTVLKEQTIETELQDLIKEIGRLVDDFDGVHDMPPETNSMEKNLLHNQDELFENMLGN